MLRIARHSALMLGAGLLVFCAPAALLAQRAIPPLPRKKDAKAAEQLFKRGSHHLAQNRLPQAEAELVRATELDGTKVQYRATLELTRSHMVTNLVREAERERASGHADAAKAKLLEARALDPENEAVAMQLSPAVDPGYVLPPETVPTAFIREAPPELKPRNLRLSFHQRGPASALLHQVLMAYGITASVDDSVPGKSIQLDLDDADFEDASQALKLLTGTFFVPLDETHALVAKDTPEKRLTLQRLSVEDVRLPGLAPAELTEITTLLRSLFDLKQVSISQDRGEISIRGTAAQLEAVNKTLADLAGGKTQLMLELRLFQVDKQRTRNLGVQLPTSESVFNIPAEVRSLVQQNQSVIDQLVSAGLVSATDYASIAALLVFYGLAGNSVLGQPFRTFGGGTTLTGYTLGQGTLNLQLNQSETKALDTVQIHLADQDTATLRSGTRYPVITGSYSALAGSSNLSSSLAAALGQPTISTDPNIAAAPPQIQYEDLGLNLKATPRVESDGLVHIALDFKIESLAGSSVNNIPLLASRQFTSNVAARDGDSILVISTLSRQESRALSGVPGVSEIPGTNLSTNSNRQFDTTDLLLVITPHVVRRAHGNVAPQMIPIPPHS